MKHFMKLNPVAFEMITSGAKTAEIRLFDEKRKIINLGDKIEFSKLPDLKDKVCVKVIGLTRAKDFETLFNIVDPILGGWKNSDNVKAAQSMEKFYSIEEEKKYGVLAIHMQKI